MNNKMNDSSCSMDNSEKVNNGTRNSTIDSTGNGDLRETKNQGDLRDITDRSGNKDGINITNSYY